MFKILNAAIFFLFSATGVLRSEDIPKLSKFADAFADLNKSGIQYYGFTADKAANQAGYSKDNLKKMSEHFKLFAVKSGVELKKFETINEPFIRVKLSTIVAEPYMTIDMTVELVELVKIERNSKEYETLAPVWKSSYIVLCSRIGDAPQNALVAGVKDGVSHLLKAIATASLPE